MAREATRVREKLTEDYRMACPRGHRSLQPAATTPTAYCQTCGRAYEFDELVDRRETGAVGTER